MSDEEVLVKNEPSSEAGEGKSKKKLFIVIGIIVVVLLLTGVSGAFFLLSKKKSQIQTKAHMKKSIIPEEDPEVIKKNLETLNKAVFFKMPPLTVNIMMDSGQAVPHYLQADVYLQLPNPTDQPIVEKMMPRIQDSLQGVLRGLHLDDFVGSQGIYRLKDILRTVINRAIYPKKIQDILITKLLVQ